MTSTLSGDGVTISERITLPINPHSPVEQPIRCFTFAAAPARPRCDRPLRKALTDPKQALLELVVTAVVGGL
jgi:hypothetical protein